MADTYNLQENRNRKVGIFVDPHYMESGPNMNEVLVINPDGSRGSCFPICGGIGYGDGAFYPVAQGDYIFELNGEGKLQAFQVESIEGRVATGSWHYAPFSGPLKRAAFWFWEQVGGNFQDSPGRRITQGMRTRFC